MTNYYVLNVEDPDVGYRARLVYTRDYPLRSWMTGVRFDREPSEPIILKLRGTDEDDWALGDLWLTPITVMSKRLYETLLKAGINNLDIYAVELHDQENDNIYHDFVAFNLVGKIAAADANKTVFAGDAKMISADIDSLSIDQTKTQNALMFRLSESVNTILVHETIVNAIQAAGIDTLTFIEPEDWAS
jgi:hypothetical protein